MLGILDINAAKANSRRLPDIDELLSDLEARYGENLRRIYAYVLDGREPNFMKFCEKLSFTRIITVKNVAAIAIGRTVIDNNKDWMIALDIVHHIGAGEQDFLLLWPSPRLAHLYRSVFALYPHVRFHVLTWDESTLSIDIANIAFSVGYFNPPPQPEVVNG